MKTTFVAATVLRAHRALSRMLPKAVLLVIVLGAIAYGGQITVFQDDFEGQPLGSDPDLPPVGEPWQVSEFDPWGVSIAPDRLAPSNSVLFFRDYRNIVLAPFAPEDRERITLSQNFAVSFDYTGFPPAGYGHFFDVSAPASAGSDPAFLIRFASQPNADSPWLHDVQYLDPIDGLIDTGLDVIGGTMQPISITADLAAETFQLDVGGESTTLPLFACPNEIMGVEFANYNIAMGSGSIDNFGVSVSAAEEAEARNTPEAASAVLLIVGGLVLVCAWMFKRSRPNP